MVAARYPEEPSQVHTPSQWQQGNTQSRQIFHGVKHQTELQPSLSMPAEVRGSLASLMFEQTRMQNMNHSRTHSGSCSRIIDTYFLNHETMTDDASLDEDNESFTQRMIDFIAKRTAQLTSVKKDGHTSSTIEAKLPKAAPAQSIEGHSLRSTKGNAEEATSATKNPSTEYLQTTGKSAATCKKDGDGSPLVMMTVLAVTLEEATEKERRSTLYSSSSHKERKSLKLDFNKTVERGKRHIPGEGQLERSTESVEKVRFDKVHDLAENLQKKSVPVKKTFDLPSQNDHSENGKNESAQKNSSLPDRKDVTHSKLNLSIDKIQFNDDQCVLTSRSGAVGKEPSAKNNVHNAESEDISEISQPAPKLCSSHFEGLKGPSWYDQLQFEDISEESQDEKTEEPSFLLSSQDTQSNREQMQSFINGGDVLDQSVTHEKQESHPNEQQIEKSVSPKTFEQAHHNSPLFCNEFDNAESDDEWIVIPVTISDLRFEPTSEDEEGVEKVQLDEVEVKGLQDQTLQPTCALSETRVFETVDSFEQATEAHITDTTKMASSWSTPDCEGDNGGELHIPQERGEEILESDDSCNTEDSCDYPSESKLNYMTISSQFLRQFSPSVTEAKTEGQQDKKVPNGQSTGLSKLTEKLRKIIQAKADTKQETNEENISKKTNQTFLDSGSDDEIDVRRKRKAKRKRRFPLRSASSNESLCSQYGKHSPGRVDTDKDSMPSEDLLQSHSTASDRQSREVMQDAQQSDKTGTCSTSVQHETERLDTLSKDTKITESSSESKTDKNCRQGARKKKFNFSEDRGSPSCTDQVASKQQSRLHSEELKETTQDLCSDLQTETKADAESDRHKIIIINSDSEDESDYNLKNNAIKRRLSSSDSKCNDYSACAGQPPPKPTKISDREDVIVLSSASDDDSDSNNKKRDKTTSETSVFASCHDRTLLQQIKSLLETFALKAAKEKHKETMLPSANSLHFSSLNDSQKYKTKDVDQIKAKDSFENVQHTTNRHKFSEEAKVFTDTDQEPRKKRSCKKVSFKRRILSSSEDSSDETVLATEERFSPEPQGGHGTVTRRPETERSISEDLSRRQHQSMDSRTDSVLGAYPIIPSFSVSSPDQIHERSKLQSHPQESSNVCSQTLKTSRVENRIQATLGKTPLVSRQCSFPPHVGPSTSSGHKSSSSGTRREARRFSVPSSDVLSSGVSREALNPSISRQTTCTLRPTLKSAKAQPSNSSSSPSTPDKICTPTECSSKSTTQFTRAKIFENWKSTFPNKGEERRRRRRRRSWLDDNLGNTCHDSSRQVVPRPSHNAISEIKPGPSCGGIREVRPGPCHSDMSSATRPEPSRSDPLRAIKPESRVHKKKPGPSHSDMSSATRPEPSRSDPLRAIKPESRVHKKKPGPSHSDMSSATRPEPSRSDPLRGGKPESRVHKEKPLRLKTKSLEFTAPLMKKTKMDYSQLPKATNRDPAQGQSYPVGENYKWGQPKKGPSRENKQ